MHDLHAAAETAEGAQVRPETQQDQEEEDQEKDGGSAHDQEVQALVVNLSTFAPWQEAHKNQPRRSEPRTTCQPRLFQSMSGDLL